MPILKALTAKRPNDGYGDAVPSRRGFVFADRLAGDHHTRTRLLVLLAALWP